MTNSTMRPKRPSRLIDHIIVRRLVDLYNPWGVLEISKESLVGYRYQRRKFSVDRGWKYDLGRINFFANQYAKQKPVNPIVIDNYCNGGRIYPIPTIIDGHHRLCGADLAGVEKIPSSYSGRVDLLNYLKGLRAQVPE